MFEGSSVVVRHRITSAGTLMLLAAVAACAGSPHSPPHDLDRWPVD
jgi:hypothetical protein